MNKAKIVLILLLVVLVLAPTACVSPNIEEKLDEDLSEMSWESREEVSFNMEKSGIAEESSKNEESSRWISPPRKEMPGTRIENVLDYQWMLNSVWRHEDRYYEPYLFYAYEEFKTCLEEEVAKHPPENRKGAEERLKQILEDLNEEYFKENVVIIIQTKATQKGWGVYLDGVSVDGNNLYLAFNESSPGKVGTMFLKLIRISKKYVKEGMTVKVV